MRILAVGLLVALTLIALQVAPGSSSKTPLAAELAFGLLCNQVQLFGFPSVQANFTNYVQQGETVNVFFVWYNSANQLVSIGGQLRVTFALGQTLSFYNTFVAPGAYTAKAFDQDLQGNALSIACSVNVTIG